MRALGRPLAILLMALFSSPSCALSRLFNSLATSALLGLLDSPDGMAELECFGRLFEMRTIGVHFLALTLIMWYSFSKPRASLNMSGSIVIVLSE